MLELQQHLINALQQAYVRVGNPRPRGVEREQEASPASDGEGYFSPALHEHNALGGVVAANHNSPAASTPLSARDDGDGG